MAKAATASGMLSRPKKFLWLFFQHRSIDLCEHIFVQPLMTLPIIFTNKNQYSNVRGQQAHDRETILMYLLPLLLVPRTGIIAVKREVFCVEIYITA